MNLENLIKDIDNVDKSLVIYQKDVLDINSDIELFSSDEVVTNLVTKNGIEYHYLIEVSIAQDFLSSWQETLSYTLTDKEMATRLFEYGINDG